MKKIKFIYVLLLFTVFIPKVYAFTYDVSTSIDSTSVKSGTVKEIKVSLSNVQGTSDGIASCSLNVTFDSSILLNSKIRTLSGWTMTTGKFYLFDTGSAVTDSSEMFVIPVKVNGAGSVKLVDIVCSDGVTEVIGTNKEVRFTISDNTSENNNNQNNNNKDSNDDGDVEVGDSSNCDLANIELSEGTIEFDPNVTEYSVKVDNIDDLEINPIIANNRASMFVDRNINEDGSNSFVITVNAPDGSSKVYTIYVESAKGTTDNSDDKSGFNFTPIFIGIICVLVLINVIRIIISSRKK